ncbi:SapB/AmfS family lanthipeptide [Streptomyces zhihengii]
MDEGWRTMPYLGAGSVGIGMVIDDFLHHRRDEALDTARRDIVQAAQATFYAQPGLFRGAAGMVLHLARTDAGGPGTEPGDVRRQIGCLSWHAMSYQGHLAFPGEQMMRLSMDLATGTAGVLLVLAAALGDRPAHLPFLRRFRGPMNRPRSRGRPQHHRPHRKGNDHEPVRPAVAGDPKDEAIGDVETGSRASLLLCGDSSLSVTTCN